LSPGVVKSRGPADGSAVAAGGVLTIEGDRFLYDGAPFEMWGIRTASGTMDDEQCEHLIAQFDDYLDHGVNTAVSWPPRGNTIGSPPRAYAALAERVTARVHHEKADTCFVRRGDFGAHSARMPRYLSLTPELGVILRQYAGERCCTSSAKEQGRSSGTLRRPIQAKWPTGCWYQGDRRLLPPASAGFGVSTRAARRSERRRLIGSRRG
jgi:hypothetical protein